MTNLFTLFCLKLVFFVLEFSFSEKLFLASCSLSATILLLSAFSLISYAGCCFILPLFSLCPSLLFLLHRSLFSNLSYRNFLCSIYKPLFSDRCSKHMLRCRIKILLTLLWHSLLQRHKGWEILTSKIWRISAKAELAFN